MPAKKLRSAMAWGFLLGILSCDGSNPTDPSHLRDTGAVEGRVIVDQTPLDGVQVTLIGSIEYTLSTDSAGKFQVSGIPPGTYVVGLSGYPTWAKFRPDRKTATVLSGISPSRIAFQGTRKPPATISGWVTVDEMGLPGAVVTLSASSLRQTVSDIDGAFSFERLDEGLHLVTVSGFDPSVHTFPTSEMAVIARYGRDTEIGFLGTNVGLEGAPPEPTGFQATPTDPNHVALEWSNLASTETELRLERRTAGSRTWTHLLALPPTTTDFLDAGLTPHTNYRYRMRACSGAACSGYSNETLATTPGPGDPNLSIAAVYLTQGVQTLRGEVPLVAGRDGFLRVFPVSEASNTLHPPVLVRLFKDNVQVHAETIEATGNSVPLFPDEGDLGGSWNLRIPGALIQPGLSLIAEVDPEDEVSELDETDNRFPLDGEPMALDTRVPPPFDLMFVPVRQSQTNLAGHVKPENADSFLELSRKLFPVSNEIIGVHGEFVTDSPPLTRDNGNGAWGSILSEINALRIAEGASGAYYGVVQTDYSGGVAGMGYQGWPIAMGIGEFPAAASVLAHELGHNWGRSHSPGCGVKDPDPSYPFLNGRVGAWGLDLATKELKSPSVYYDLMGYCRPHWISDHTYESILDFRELHGGGLTTAEPQPSLLLWGRIEEGRLILEPAFEITTIPSLPSQSGDYVLEGLGADGERLFRFSFNPQSIPEEGRPEGHFAFALPLGSFPEKGLNRLLLSGGGLPTSSRMASSGPQMAPRVQNAEITAISDDQVQMKWNPIAYPAALVRDPSTGQILSIARGGAIGLSPPSREIEVLFSNGVGTSKAIRRTWR